MAVPQNAFADLEIPRFADLGSEPAPGDERNEPDEDSVGDRQSTLDEGYEGPGGGDEGGGPDQDAAAKAVEDQARAQGWVPEREWVSSRPWKSAKDYLDFRQHYIPAIQDELAETKRKLAAIEQKEAERDRQESERTAKVEKQTLMAEIQAAMDNQDTARATELIAKLSTLPAPAPRPTVQPNKIDPEVQAEWNAFIAQNPWVNQDKELRVDFGLELKNISLTPGAAATTSEALYLAKRRVMKMNPDKFQRREGAPMAETRGNHGAAGNGKRKWEDLKPHVRREFEGLIENTSGLTKEGILKNCEADHFKER